MHKTDYTFARSLISNDVSRNEVFEDENEEIFE